MSGKPKILFLDDDLLLLKAVELITRNSPFEFYITTSVKEARSWLKIHDFQVVYSDFHMPVCNGVEFLSEVAKICPRSIRILVSASLGNVEAQKSVKQAHIFGFLKKPFGKANFDEHINLAIQAYERQNN